MAQAESPPRIFLSYAREDQAQVDDLYRQLVSAGFQPWMDTRDILPGEVWMESIRSAIEQSDFFIACLSPNSVLKRGVLQKEFKSALDIWQGMLDSDIYFIPVRLADCAVPSSMTRFQWVDLFENDGFSRLERALQKGIERRTAEILTPKERLRKPDADHNEDHKLSWVNLLKELARSRKRKPVPFWGSMIGALVMTVMLPWVFNNYFYQVKRPTLPDTCQVSHEPVRVGLARLAGCSPTFQDELASNWMGETIETSIIPQAFDSSDRARRQSKYDIVVWGSCENSTDDTAHLTFELITSRKPYGVYEPSNLQVSGSQTELSDVGLALMNYQHGDYSEASQLFDSLPGSVNSSMLSLVQANSLLYAERYTAAINSFEKVAQSGDRSAAAAYNNMGIAYFNQDADLSLDQYNQSIEVARNQNAPEIESLALVNRSQYYRRQSDWTNAHDDCSAALALNGQSALPYLCMSNYYIMYYTFSSVIGPLPFTEIDRNLNESARQQDAPPLIHYVRGYWHLNHFWKHKQEAVNSYTAYLGAMENRACLQTDHDLIADTVETIKSFTSP